MSPALFGHVASLEARKRLSYRADFWLNAILGLAVQVVVAYFIVLALFRESGRERVGGYTLEGMVVYYVTVVLVGRLVSVTEMEQGISQDIYDGGLSRYLLYPAPYALVKYAQQLGALLPAALQAALFAGWMPFVFGVPEGVSIASVGMGLVAIAVGTLLLFLLTWPIQAVAFWADNVWSLMIAHRIASRLLGGMLVPLSLFPDGARAVLELLPFRYLFAFPVECLLGRVGPAAWAAGLAAALAWCGVLALAGREVWRRGDLRYTGVGM